MAAKQARDMDQFVLRLPDGMRDRIRSAALENGRSMNAELISALETRYPIPKTAEDVAQEVAWFLASVEPELRKDAIALLSRYADNGHLFNLSEGYALAEKEERPGR